MRRMHTFLKLLIAALVVAAPFAFPKLSPIVGPLGIIALIVLLLSGQKSEQKWEFKMPRKNRKFLDSSTTDITDLDPTNPFGTYDDYY